MLNDYIAVITCTCDVTSTRRRTSIFT